jgi:hypothetical protein
VVDAPSLTVAGKAVVVVQASSLKTVGVAPLAAVKVTVSAPLMETTLIAPRPRTFTSLWSALPVAHYGHSGCLYDTLDTTTFAIGSACAVDDFARIIASFETAANDAKAEVVKANALVADATRKVADLQAHRDDALREADQALELLRLAPHRIAEAICAAALRCMTRISSGRRRCWMRRVSRGVSL